MKRFTIFLTLSLFTMLLSACGGSALAAEAASPTVVTIDDTVIAEGRLEPIRYTELSFSAGGVIEDIVVSEGQNVAEGDLIANLENIAVLQAEVKRAEAAILEEVSLAYEAVRVAQQRLDNFSVPSKFAGLTPIEAAAEMKIKVDQARMDFEPYMGYDNPRGFVKDLEEALENAWADYNRALDWMEREAALEAAELRLAQANTDYSSLQENESSAVQSTLSAAQISLSNAELRSPISGRVADMNIKVGESVGAGVPVVTIADFSDWIIRTTDLNELDVVSIEKGQSVSIILDALPNEELKGVVASIGETFSNSQGDIVYEVTITLEETHPDIRWGMTAFVEFLR